MSRGQHLEAHLSIESWMLRSSSYSGIGSELNVRSLNTGDAPVFIFLHEGNGWITKGGEPLSLTRNTLNTTALGFTGTNSFHAQGHSKEWPERSPNFYSR